MIREKAPSLPALFMVALVIASAISVAVPDKHPLVPVLLGAIVGSFVLGLNSPSWLLVPLFITELSVYGYYLPGGVSLRLGTALIATAMALRSAQVKALLRDPRFRLVIVPALGFVVLCTIGNVLHSDVGYAFKYFRYQLVQVLILIIVAAVIRNREELLQVARVALIVGVVCGLAALWQHHSRESAPYGEGSAKIVAHQGRSIGFGDSPVLLANDLAFVLLPVVGVLVAGSIRAGISPVALASSGAVILAGCYFTYTRSTQLAIGVSLVPLGLLLRGRMRAIVLGIVLAGVILYPLLKGSGIIGRRYYESAHNDQSAASHIALWQVGLAVALDNPIIGIGHEQFEEVSTEYEGDLSGDAARGAGAIGQDRPHNDFLSVWMSWGLAALLVYIALFLVAIWNCLVAARCQDYLIRGLAIGTIAGVVRYAADSAFHNYMDSSTLLWASLGLSVVLARLAASYVTTRERTNVTRPVVLVPYLRRKRFRQTGWRRGAYGPLPG